MFKFGSETVQMRVKLKNDHIFIKFLHRSSKNNVNQIFKSSSAKHFVPVCRNIFKINQRGERAKRAGANPSVQYA